MRNSTLALAASQAGFLLAMLATYGALPDRLASHFAADGRPDAWTSRPRYVVALVIAATLTAAACTAPMHLARRLPDSLINIPNREYWLAPERRDRTFDGLSDLGRWIAVTTTLLWTAMHLLTVWAHRAQPPRLPLTHGLVVLSLYLAGLGVVVYVYGFRAWRIDDDERARGKAPSL